MNPVLPGSEIRKLIQTKGWNISDAARFWGISRQRLYQVFAQTTPALLWQCAAEGLPVHSPALVKLAKTRPTKKPGHIKPGAGPVRNLVTRAAGYTLHEILVTTSEIGEIATEGEEGTLSEIKRDGNYWRFLVRFERGEDWFSDYDLNNYMASTGRSREEY